MNLDEFNDAPEEELVAMLLACADIPWWAEAIAEARPFHRVDDLVEYADKAARDFSDANVERALAAHPRIGERKSGDATEAAWSRQEQATAATTDDELNAQLARLNTEYEQRFGRVFLICASGLSAEQIVAAARARLLNDDEKERSVVADELRKIALLRLGRLVS